MVDWRHSATVWLNDPDRGRVVIGPFGFAWWQGKKVYVASFTEYLYLRPLLRYRLFKNWGDATPYAVDAVTPAAVVRFVKTGLLP